MVNRGGGQLFPKAVIIQCIYIYIYDREIKMCFYLAMVGFEPTPTSTAAPSNTETTVIPSRPLRSLKKELSWPRFMLDFPAIYI